MGKILNLFENNDFNIIKIWINKFSCFELLRDKYFIKMTQAKFNIK